MDDLIEETITKLDENNELDKILNEFELEKNNVNKVLLVRKILEKLNIIPGMSKPLKNNKLASDFCKSGDKWQLQGTINSNFNALVNYNESICFAEINSLPLKNAYVKRAIIYYKLELYEYCLKNIELANEIKCDGSSAAMNDVLQLEAKCKDKLLKHTNVSKKNTQFKLKLSLSPHSKVPFIADCLDIRQNEQYGRYIITHQNLDPGQIVAIEEPHFTVLLPKLRYQKCATCLKENSLSLIPCSHCTSAMFCSVECLQRAEHTFHKFECPIIHYLHEYFNKFHLSALRATIMAFLAYNTQAELSDTIELAKKNKPVTVFTARDASPQENYLLIHTFPTKQSDRTSIDLLSTAIVASVSASILTAAVELDENIVMELLFHHLQISRMYFHSLSQTALQYQSEEGGLLGSGAFPFCSLINHACTPNILRIPFGSKMVIFVLRPIKKGEQLFDNYGSHHYTDTLENRQMAMKQNYLFKCECAACTFDFSKFTDLPVAPEVNPVIPMNNNAIKLNLQGCNQRFAIENYKKFAKFLKVNDHIYPCAQLNLFQQYFRESLHIIAGNISMKFKY